MQAVIICGGKGLRLKSITKNKPKALAKFNKIENLACQINMLKKNGVNNFLFLVNNFEKEISLFLKKKYHKKFIICKDKNYFGTGGAIYSAKKRLHNNFLIVYSDLYFNFNFKNFVKYSKKKKAILSCVVHANDHPIDSDTVFLDKKFYITQINKKTSKKFKMNNAISGIYFAQKKFLNLYNFKKNRNCDLVNDIFPKLIKKGSKIFAYKSIEYIKDFGTPDRFKRVSKDVRLNKIKNLNYQSKTRAVFIDRDGVINKESNKIKTYKNFKILPKVNLAIKKMNLNKIPCFIVSNQSGLARKTIALNEIFKIIYKLDKYLSDSKAYVDDFLICPHYEKIKFNNNKINFFSDFRKPNPGMIFTLAKRYNIDLKKSFMIGDTDIDVLTVKRAGLKTILVKSPKIKDYVFDIRPDYRVKDLNSAVNIVLRK